MTLHYWQGIHVDDIADVEIYQNIFDKLLNGYYQGASLDLKRQGKKGSHPIFGVRINDSDRLLFTTVEVDGKPYLKLLDVVLNHDYQKSRFFKSGVLREYLEKYREEIAQQIREGKNLITESLEANTETEVVADEPVVCFPVHFYNHQFITLNSEQEQVLQAKLPVVVSGGPGSGKSCVAISLLEQLQEKLADTENPRPLLYVTQSKGLADDMQRLWDELPQGAGLPEVQFKTYTELLREVAPEVADRELVGDAEFKAWLSEHIRNQKSQRKTAKDSFPGADFFKQTDLIYQEFRLMSGFSPEDYRNLGRKQCHFNEGVEKDWLLNAYSTYQRYLDDNKLLHPAFFPLNKTDVFSAIVVDEAQDLSTGQLQDLLQLSTDSQTCYLMDSHQSLLDNISQRSALLNRVREKNYTLSHITLPFSYRCPPNITEIANKIIQLKTQLTGGRVDQHEASEIKPSQHHKNTGSVRWFTKFSEEEKADFVNAAKSTNIAIVTPAHYKEEARALFGTELVFTPEEVKGLEYPTIIAYRIFDMPLYTDANAILAKGEVRASSEHRAKKGEGDDKFGPPFNKIFTAFTRAMSQLIIFQDSTHANEHITRPLQQIVKNQAAPADLSGPSTPAASSIADWKAEAARLFDAGNIQQAEAILEKIRLSEAQNKTEDSAKKTNIEQAENQPKIPRGKGKGKAKKKTKAQKKRNKGNKEAGASSSGPQSDLLLAKQLQAKKSDTQAQSELARPSDLSQDEIFVEELYKNPSPAAFKKLLAREDRSKLLLNTPFGDHSSLITAITERPQSHLMNLLAALVTMPEQRLQLSINDLSVTKKEGELPLIASLCKSSAGVRFLNLMLNHNPQLMPAITAESLCVISTNKDSPDFNTSALFYLCSTPEGQITLKKLLENNSSLVKGITKEALCRQKEKDGYSPLHHLCNLMEGPFILKILLEGNRTLAEELTFEDLICPLYRKNADGSETFLMTPRGFLEAASAETRQVLDLIPCMKGRIEKDEVRTDFYTVKKPGSDHFFNSKAGKEGTSSAVAPQSAAKPTPMISKSQKYVEDLFEKFKDTTAVDVRILEANLKEVFDKPPAEKWFFEIPCKDFPCLIDRLVSKKKISILLNFLEKNTKCKLSPTASHLSLVQNGKPSTLFYLSLNEGGRKFLNFILTQNENIAVMLWGNTLCSTFANAKPKHCNTSPLYWLSLEKDGQLILKELLEKNPKISERITATALCRTRIPGENYSSLYNLCQTPIGLSVLKTLFTQNPSIANAITAQDLDLPVYVHPPGGKRIPFGSPRSTLLETPEGQEIFALIPKAGVREAGKEDASSASTPGSVTPPLSVFEKNQQFVENLFRRFTEINLKQVFDKPYPEKWFFDIPGRDYPCLIAKLVSEGKIQILLNFLKTNKEYHLSPTSNALNIMKNGKPSLIFYLTQTKEGREFLSLILKECPDVAKGFSGTELVISYENTNPEHIHTFALFWLCMEEDGQLLLKKLLEENPEFSKYIYAKTLCKLIPGKDNSPFHMLCNTPVGISVLKTLFTQNLSLAKSIKDEHAYLSESPLQKTLEGQEILALMSDATKEESQEQTKFSVTSRSEGSSSSLTSRSSVKPHSKLFARQVTPTTNVSPDNLLTNFNETGLEKAFSQPEPEKWFFDVPMRNYPSLMLGIVRENKTQIFLNFLEKYKCNISIAAKDLCETKNGYCSIIFYLSITKPGRKLLNRILSADPKLASELDLTILKKTVDDKDSRYFNMSTYSNLSSTLDGQEILKLIPCANLQEEEESVSEPSGPKSPSSSHFFQKEKKDEDRDDSEVKNRP